MKLFKWICWYALFIYFSMVMGIMWVVITKGNVRFIAAMLITQAMILYAYPKAFPKYFQE